MSAIQIPTPMTLPAPVDIGALQNPIRRMGIFALSGLVFLEISRLHEVLAFLARANSFILYLFAVPALIALVGSGGLTRALRERAVQLWIALVGWMFLCVPFSFWPGDSAVQVVTYLRVIVPVLLLLAGLPMTWPEVRKLLYVLAVAGLMIIVSGRVFLKAMAGREGLQFGLIGNPNDYAAHLILVLGFVAFLVISPGTWFGLRSVARAAGVLGIAYALYLILSTGSRGALLALAVASLYLFLRSSMGVRVVLVVVLPLAAIAFAAAVPRPVLMRLLSFSIEDQVPAELSEARESAISRQHLLEESLKLSFLHPLFGVGPGQFGDYEGSAAKERHQRGDWLNTHNSFTQISSECGLPALFLYLGAVIATFSILREIARKVRGRPEFRQIAVACMCLSTAYIGFLVAMFFVNFGYFFYLPLITGLVVAMRRGVNLEIALRSAAPVAAPVILPMAVPVAALTVPARRAPNPYRFNRMR